MKTLKIALSFILLTPIVFTSCTTVKAYQKNKLNDSEMTLGTRKVEKTDNAVIVIRCLPEYRQGIVVDHFCMDIFLVKLFQ